VVHLNGTLSHGALPWRAPVVVTAHSCVCSWWRAVKGCDAPECDWGHYRRAVACGLHAADVVAAPTHAMLNDLAVPYGRPSRSVVVPNGRCPESFSRPNVAKEPFVLSAGRFWDEAKNVETLLVAAPSLPWPVFLAGEAGDQGKSAPRNVRLLGRLDAGAMVALMARASVFASPARYEPFGLTALEAALSGCALVLGDLPSLREVWGDAALFVPPDDPKALSVAVNSLICDARRRAEFATRARDRAAEYTAERMARGYLALYDDLIAARSGEGAARLTRDPLAAVPSLPAGAAPAKASSWRLCTAWTEGTCDA
jgi:glycosyltransferase involved in cell wall biosynthesis